MGCCFYFRFVPDAVLRSPTMSSPVEVDRACPKTLLQSLRSRWYRFPSRSYNYFRYPSAILEFLGEGSVGWGRHIHQWKNCSPKHRYSHWHCVDICFCAKLLVLPVWDTVFTSGLHTMLFSKVQQCRYPWNWIGRALKHCCSPWDDVDIVFRRKVITTSGIRPPCWSFWVKGEVGMYNIAAIPMFWEASFSEIVSISVSVAKLLVLPVCRNISTSGLYLMLT